MHGYAPEGYIAKEQAKGAVLGSDWKWNDILLDCWWSLKLTDFLNLFSRSSTGIFPQVCQRNHESCNPNFPNTHTFYDLYGIFGTKISPKKRVQNISHVVLDRHRSRECPACGSQWGYTKHDQLVLACDNVCNTSMWPPSLYLNELV